MQISLRTRDVLAEEHNVICTRLPDYFLKDGPWEDQTAVNGASQMESADKANTWNYYVF